MSLDKNEDVSEFSTLRQCFICWEYRVLDDRQRPDKSSYRGKYMCKAV